MLTSQRQVMGILIAAVAAEWARKGTLYPLDTITTRLQYSRRPITRLQLAEAKVADSQPSAVTQLEQIRTIVRNGGGPLSLYKGIGTQLVGVVPTSLVYMPTYELVTELMRSLDATHFSGAGRLPASQIASVATGVVSSCVRVPISVVKVTCAPLLACLHSLPCPLRPRSLPPRRLGYSSASLQMPRTPSRPPWRRTGGAGSTPAGPRRAPWT